MTIQIPPGAQVIEMPSSTIWFDKDGILYSVSKGAPEGGRNMEELKKEMQRFREIIGGRKVCIIMETSRHASNPPKEHRDIIAAELASVAKAMAVVSPSPLSRMTANLFFSFKPPAYPMKIFSSEAEASNWIRQYL